MSDRRIADVAHSVRDRLLTMARRDRIDFNVLMSRYVAERFLYRLSRSRFRDRFVLKGAMLFSLWLPAPYRPTRDLDLLGSGDLGDERLREILQAIFDLPVQDDGLIFDSRSIRISEIRAEQEYQGKRILVDASLGKAVIRLQVDIGIGDVVVPPPEEVAYPAMLDLPAPRLKAYTRETVVAEKFQAMVSLGMLNSRMKDWFDVRTLAREFAFDGQKLVDAVRATFRRRGTSFSEQLPDALSDRFIGDPLKQTQWQAFLRNHGLGDDLSLADAVAANRQFLKPIHHAAAVDRPFPMTWPPGGPWSGL